MRSGSFLKSFDSREFLPLQKLKGRSTPRREVCDSCCNAGCRDCGHGVTTGNDTHEVRITRGKCLRQCLTPLTVRLYFKQTHRTVPKHHSCLFQFLRKLSDGLRSDIQPHPIRWDVANTYRWVLSFAVTGKMVYGQQY